MTARVCSSPLHVWLVALGLASACTGEIGGMGATSSEPGDPARPGGRPSRPGDAPAPGSTAPGSMNPGPSAQPGAGPVAGVMPMRRLGRVEYENTLRALFGATTNPGVALPDDALGESSYEWPANVGGVELDRFEQAAYNVAQGLTARIRDLVPCAVGTAERSCAAEL